MNIKKDLIKYSNNNILYKHIINLLVNNNFDFIAFVFSHWHAIGVDSFIYDIFQRSNKKPRGIIIVVSLTEDGFRINENDFTCKDFADVEFCFANYYLNKLQNQKSIIFRAYKVFKKLITILVAIDKIKNQKKGNKKKLYIISTVKPNISLLQIFKNKNISSKYFPAFSLICEGTGNYVSKKTLKMQRNFSNQNKKFKCFINDIGFEIRQMVSNFLEEIALKYITVEKRFLFSKKYGRYIQNRSIVNSYKNIFKKTKKYIKNTKKIISPIIIITTPFSEFKLASLKYELGIMEDVINILIKRGFNIFIKPHPIENTNKYIPILKKFEREKVRLIPQNIAIEHLFLPLDPLCVIGYSSTALINANIIFDIPAISINKLLLNSNNISGVKNKLSKTMCEDPFKDLSKGIVYSVDNFENLENVLNSIKPKMV